MDKKSFIPTIILLVLLLSWYIYGKTFGLRYLKTECRMEKSIVFNKKVKDIVQDSINHPLSNIIFSDGYIYKTPYSYGLWNKLEVGDSVVKKINTLRYIIYRHCDTFQIDTFGKDKDCEKIGKGFYND